jgi:hypothetical protein
VLVGTLTYAEPSTPPAPGQPAPPPEATVYGAGQPGGDFFDVPADQADQYVDLMRRGVVGLER